MSWFMCKIAPIWMAQKALMIRQPLRWRHNEWDGVSNHQPQDCLLNRLSGPRSKKTSKPRVTGLCAGIHRGPVNSPHKWPVTRKLFPFGDVIMNIGSDNGLVPPHNKALPVPIFTHPVLRRHIASISENDLINQPDQVLKGVITNVQIFM